MADFELSEEDQKILKLGKEFFLQIFGDYMEERFDNQMKKFIGCNYMGLTVFPDDQNNIKLGMYNLLRDTVPRYDDIKLQQRECYKLRKMFDLYYQAYDYTELEFATNFAFFNWEQFSDYNFALYNAKPPSKTTYNKVSMLEYFRQIFDLIEIEIPFNTKEETFERLKIYGNAVKSFTKLRNRTFKICVTDTELFGGGRVLRTTSSEPNAQRQVMLLTSKKVYDVRYFYYPVTPPDEDDD